MGRPGLTGPVLHALDDSIRRTRSTGGGESRVATHSSSMRVKGLIAGCPVDEWAHLALLIRLPEIDVNISS